MFAYAAWPVMLVVISNIVYQICAKEVPGSVSPLASLTITYLVAAIISGILYFALTKDANIFREYSKVNWASFVLGLVIVGLEVGLIYAYKLGWPVSTLVVVQSSFIAVGVLIVGRLVYHEAMPWNKIVGVLICMVGISFINYK